MCGHLVAAGFALSLGGCLSVGQGSSSGGAGGVSATTPPPPPVTQEAPNGRKVVVATFNVGFSRETVRGAQSRGLMARGTASAQAKTKLEGVPEHGFQQIADAGHQDLVKRLRAAGFDVVAPTQSATYNALSGGQNPRYAHDAANSRGVISFNMQQMQINAASALKPVAAAGDPGALAFGELDFNSAGRMAAEANAEKVLTVRHVVDYVSQTSSNDLPLGGLSGRASVSTEQGMSLRPGQSANFYGPQSNQVRMGTGAYAVQFKGTSSPEPFAGSQSANTAGQSASNGVSMASAILTGGMSGLVGSGGNAIVANPQAYERIALSMISTANAQIVRSFGQIANRKDLGEIDLLLQSLNLNFLQSACNVGRPTSPPMVRRLKSFDLEEAAVRR